MRTEFRASFARDLRKIRNADVLTRIRSAILSVEEAVDIRSIPNLKKLSGGGPFRIRMGDYRIGLRIEADIAVFIRVLPRSDIYRYFP
ncbi:type II toxin-antitoxin system RelE/ParE family toxin [soil metagenome]